MADLIAKSALEGLVPVTHGALVLSDATPAAVTSVAPFRGKGRAVAEALAPMGLTLPAPNRMETGPVGRIVWFGPGQALLLDAAPGPLAGLAALTDQSDGWVGLRLAGPGTEEVLARLVPIDLRPPAFGPGAAARAPLGHMTGVVMRADDGIEILVFRSMARTAVHEIATAMRQITAREG
ncbi:sarcosine oxidase subunit gamma [Acidimangrovimonas sediminis]|uniref:sarcosine oxidase subunit gamma n=1 Tax=Acidimangrovimonas sediminis TaxID=2056283 RepID=UPI001E586834|nr:sarcosine oxidase subunit gamma [Acidimangrovimonas sediminis]